MTNRDLPRAESTVSSDRTGAAAPSLRALAHGALGALGALAVLGATGCAGEFEDDDLEVHGESAEATKKAAVFKRVVIGRAYQTGDSTLPAIDLNGDGVPEPRDAAYVCEVLKRLKPTFVSGLMRYGAKRKGKPAGDGSGPKVIPRDEVTPEEDAFFHDVRACVTAEPGLHHTKFDVVLNADEYETVAEVRSHMLHLHDRLKPDAWYFDFFARGWDTNRASVVAAIQFAKQRHQLIGGTVWGTTIPEHTDYVALDDYEGPETAPGWQRMTSQATAIRKKHPGLPILFHLENNPTGKENNHGDDWVEGSTAHRISLLTKHAEGQDKVGYHLMYPVFFPISLSREGFLAPFADMKGMPLAYDANLDPKYFQAMKALMGKHNSLGGGSSGGGSSGGGADPNGGKCDTSKELKVCRSKCEKAYKNQQKRQACKADCEKKCG